MRQPEIHVFKYVRGGWIWALIDNYGSYHYFENRQFPTAAEAKQFALDHIGTPHYGGSYQTVHGWRTPKVKIHKRGPDFAGMLAANPGGRASNPKIVMKRGDSEAAVGNPAQMVFHSRQAALDYALAHGATQFSIRKLRS